MRRNPYHLCIADGQELRTLRSLVYRPLSGNLFHRRVRSSGSSTAPTTALNQPISWSLISSDSKSIEHKELVYVETAC